MTRQRFTHNPLARRVVMKIRWRGGSDAVPIIPGALTRILQEGVGAPQLFRTGSEPPRERMIL